MVLFVLRMKNQTLRRWELALLLGVAIAALAGSWLSGQQAALAGQVVRLHVVGASDSAEDQAVKLRVRDAVLAQAGDYLSETATQAEARAALSAHLTELAQAGAAVSGAPVTAQIEDNAWFPTKRYNNFALPAGGYTALKITVGEGEGRNWWCVVFPPLCLGSVSETVSETAANLDPDQVSLITGEDEGYVVKFKAIELWEQWTRDLSKTP